MEKMKGYDNVVRINFLFQLAVESYALSPELAAYYITQMKTVARKAVQRL